MRCEMLNSSTLPATSTVWPNLRSLNERLQMAEVLGKQVSKDLNIILEELRNVSKAANATDPPTSHTTSNFSAGSVCEMYLVGLDQPVLYDGSLTLSSSNNRVILLLLVLLLNVF